MKRPHSHLTSDSEFDWNFDAVPDSELVACCYWEYARESAFMRELCQRCLDGRQNGKEPDAQLWSDLERLAQLGFAAEIFVPGYFHLLEPFTTAQWTGDRALLPAHFPKAWQTLEPRHRARRALIRTSRDINALVPFQRGPIVFAKWITEYCDVEKARASRRPEACRSPREGTAPSGIVPRLFSAGSEISLFEINWSQFTNDEIAAHFRKWLKRNRPTDLGVPDGRGREKARDWRVALERLGMQRLLHEFRLGEMSDACPEAWTRYKKREWYKERKRAGEMFHRLFPFLPKADRPLNWATKGGRSR